jgi:diaminopimelate decarboxylase
MIPLKIFWRFSMFEYENSVLSCQGVSLELLADEFDTPLYVYDGGYIEAQAMRFVNSLHADKGTVCYAVKANANLTLLKKLAGLGVGADVVSGNELKAALTAGFPPERIIFSSNGKKDWEIDLAIESGIMLTSVCSNDEVRSIQRRAEELDGTLNVAIRLNPVISLDTHPYIATGLKSSKFGIPFEYLPDFVELIEKCDRLNLIGLHCHIGSQIFDRRPFERALGEMVQAIEFCRGRGIEITHLDLGGGFGVDYKDGREFDIEGLVNRFSKEADRLGVSHLLIEPGRSMIAKAGVLVGTVLTIKEVDEYNFLVIDVGMNDNIRPSLYGAYHRIQPVVLNERERRVYEVVGPVCESGDFQAKSRELPEMKVGERVAVHAIGAYGYIMGSRYNFRPLGAEVLVENGEARLIRRRETFDDLIAADLGV